MDTTDGNVQKRRLMDGVARESKTLAVAVPERSKL
jgi:hypothetical protein